MKKSPMTSNEAKENIAAMKAETSKASMVKLIRLALKVGNLSEEAKQVYKEALYAF